MNEPLAPATTPNANDPRYKRTMVEFALLYAKEGHRVFPLHSPLPAGGCTCGNESCHSIGKHPRTANGVKDASTDRDVIGEWWRLYPKTKRHFAHPLYRSYNPSFSLLWGHMEY